MSVALIAALAAACGSTPNSARSARGAGDSSTSNGPAPRPLDGAPEAPVAASPGSSHAGTLARTLHFGQHR